MEIEYHKKTLEKLEELETSIEEIKRLDYMVRFLEEVRKKFGERFASYWGIRLAPECSCVILDIYHRDPKDVHVLHGFLKKELEAVNAYVETLRINKGYGTITLQFKDLTVRSDLANDSKTCQRVQTGVKEVPVYEVKCGEGLKEWEKEQKERKTVGGCNE